MATLSSLGALTPFSLRTARHTTSCSSSTSKDPTSGSRLMRVRCSNEEFQDQTVSRVRKPVQCLAVASVAAAVLLTSASQATAEDLYSKVGSMCNVAALPERSVVLKLEAGENAFEEEEPSVPLVMGGMTMKNFNPARYSGRWFEVASLKLGFSGQGQEDCHCTQEYRPSHVTLTRLRFPEWVCSHHQQVELTVDFTSILLMGRNGGMFEWGLELRSLTSFHNMLPSCGYHQGVYTFDEEKRAIKVDTFCIHGSPTGYITGIRGRVQCVSDEDLSKLQSDFERKQMIQQKCFLRFPSLPFIPKQPYNVLNTDYDNFALVSGSRDTSFVQIYSRTPNPGQEFIDKYKNELKDIGYNPELIKDTPQDCEVMSMPQLEGMMSGPGMEEAMTNVFPTLELSNSGLQLNPFASTFETLKKLVVETFFK